MASDSIGNIHEYSVSELSSAIKRSIEDGFGFVRVKGELGRVSRPQSGHVYLDLKDEKAVINGVIWKGVASRLKIAPEQGMEVVATGKLTTFPGQSRYQIVIDSLEPAGVGALMALFEERKKKLAAEGLFDPARKKELPFLPSVIGVVTSPSGAVIRDILHRLRERFPRHVLVWPSLVQGRGAENAIASAIQGFNALAPGGAVPRPDVLIVARGGGSLEDLWCFNEEIVARAAAASEIPLISAVGHETDTTLIDFVADRRAPTPTAAAEMASPVRTELLAELLNKERRMVAAASQGFAQRRTALTAAERGLGRPEDLLGPSMQRLDRASDRLKSGLRMALDGSRARLAKAALSPALLRQRRAIAEQKAEQFGGQLKAALQKRLDRADAALREQRLPKQMLARQLETGERRVAQLWPQADNAARRAIALRADRLMSLSKLMTSLSYQSVLKRGFALVRDETGGLIREAGAGAVGAGVTLQFADGARSAILGEASDTPLSVETTSHRPTDLNAVGENAPSAKTKSKKAAAKTKSGADKPTDNGQTSLFD